jgi:hypothetical protein
MKTNIVEHPKKFSRSALIEVVGDIHTVRKIRSAGEYMMTYGHIMELTDYDHVKGGFVVNVDFSLSIPEDEKYDEYFNKSLKDLSERVTTYVQDYM